MSQFAIGLITGLLVLFLGWSAKSFFFSRRLYLVQPKLFDYSKLVSDRNAKTVELTVINAGVRPEEDVRVQLSPHFSYLILASNISGLSVDEDGGLAISRIAPKQDLTVVLVAEGGEFRKEHVMGISSKDVVGKIKDSVSEAKVTPIQSAAAVVVVFVLLPLFSFLIGRSIEREFAPLFAAQFSKEIEVKYEMGEMEERHVGTEEDLTRLYASSFVVDQVIRSGDVIRVAVRLSNPTDKRLSFDLSTATSASEHRSYRLGINPIEHNVVVFPGAEKIVTLADYLPGRANPQKVVLGVRVDGEHGLSSFTQEIDLKD